MPSPNPPVLPKAVLFDLLTALLDSWTLWNRVAGSEAAGRAWRAEYLRLTYGCGAYVAYEDLVRTAARTTGLPASVADALETRWHELPVWSGAQATLDVLRGRTKLAVVTNCSVRLGVQASERLNTPWDCIVTAEEAGFYKPDPHPYRLALAKLGIEAREAAFVAGSGYDLFGTSAVGLRSYWHNRVGLARPDGAPAASLERPTLESLVPWLEGHSL
jgi:2-haloacid dehalogenase